MKLERLTPAHVKQAVAIYMDHAWPGGVKGASSIALERLQQQGTLRGMRAVFEASAIGKGPRTHRYCMRLGNERYPWMKFVLQEYLLDGEFFFSVDTHDDLRIDPATPDYESWCELQRYNRGLKKQIEETWAAAQLPTHGDLRALCEGIERLGADGDVSTAHRGKRLLVVDDDEDVACGEAAVLRAIGFQVETAYDGRQVLERMSMDPLPDLVVLDFSMPEFDGDEVMRRLRADSRTAEVPLLLATASEIDLETVQRASGLLRKPYPRSVLFAMIERLLTDAATG